MAIMEECGFPVIPRYLEKQHYPQDFIQGAKVTHIWTQDQALSRHHCKYLKYSHVVDDFHELIDSVDGLLARDDFESHLYFAKPFLQSGMPIYIDKPLAVSVRKARQLLDLQCYRTTFSCSALKYSNELIPNKKQLSEIGPVQQIFGFSPKAWDTYAIHVIEPILMSLPHDDQLVNGWNSSGRTNLLAIFLLHRGFCWIHMVTVVFLLIFDILEQMVILILNLLTLLVVSKKHWRILF